MKPLTNRRFWFYSEWEYFPGNNTGFINWFRVNFKGSDEYGHHTFVIPMGKGRAVVIAYRAGYKKFRHCEYCAEAREQTLLWEQEMCYIQTYWNIEDYDDVFDLSNDEWDEALGV